VHAQVPAGWHDDPRRQLAQVRFVLGEQRRQFASQPGVRIDGLRVGRPGCLPRGWRTSACARPWPAAAAP
jgi:hypothetical protein